MRSLIPLLLLSACLFIGCTPSADPTDGASSPVIEAVQQDPDERAAVLEALQNIKQEAFQAAFASLPDHQYTRYTRTEQLDEAGRRTAFHERVVRVGGADSVVTLQADSSGIFDQGALGRFVSSSDAHDPSSLPQYVLLDDPPYLAPRNREAFRYRFLPDTTLWGRTTRVIEVQARHGTDQSIRRARLYVDRATEELTAYYLQRTEETLFVDEERRLYLQIRPAPSAGWVPLLTQVTLRLHLPLHPPQHHRTTSAYYRYDGRAG